MTLKKIGVMAFGLALILGPVAVLAQSLDVTITSPTDGSEVKVGQTVNFTGEATGGDEDTYAFNWTWGDGTETSSGSDNGETSAEKTYDQTGEVTVQLRVTDLDGVTGTDEINITVVEEDNDNDVDELEIFNVEVSDVTYNSAVITWETNLPADSRVIYDTESHPDIDEDDGPNYGYANSTSTYNEDNPVTEHEVELTGLSSNTEYFFRVLSRAEI